MSFTFRLRKRLICTGKSLKFLRIEFIGESFQLIEKTECIKYVQYIQ